MSKAPAFQFYPSDWQRDMDDYPLEIEGAWIRICCRLYWSGGTSTRSLDEWSKILREKPRKTLQIFEYFQSKNICNLVNQNGSITITSRRIAKDEYIRNIRKEAGLRGGNPNLKPAENRDNLVNQNVEQKPTPSSSSSSSKQKEHILSGSSPDQSNHIPYKGIVDCLNEYAGTHFRYGIGKTEALIKARHNEGFKLEDFITVIKKKTADWNTDPKMMKFLRPETLFGSKFEGYLNE